MADFVLTARERDAKQLSAFYAGETDRHPHGLSGRSHILPADLTSDTRDCARHEFSEWGNAAGMV